LVLRRTGVVGHTWEAMNHTVRRSLFLWLPVLFWLAVIAHFSGQPFSKQDLAPVLQRYPRLVQAVTALPEVQFRYAGSVLNNRRDPVRFLQFILRKAAHLFLYGMYGLSLMRALAGSGLIGARGFGLAAILVVLVAMLDEHNQARIAGRSGRPEDVALDFAGFLLFCSVIWGCALGRQCWRSAARRAPPAVPRRGPVHRPGQAADRCDSPGHRVPERGGPGFHLPCLPFSHFSPRSFPSRLSGHLRARPSALS